MSRPAITTPTSVCQFGIARGDITPPVGIYHRMWGAALHDRSEGVHRPLTATALVFRSVDTAASPATLQVLVALDHCLLGRTEMESLLETIQRRTGTPRECLVVTFSHTHAAGLMSLDRVDLPGGELIPAYLARVNDTAAELVAEAQRTAVAATITYGVGRCDLAAHRDFWDESTGQWVCGFHPGGAADDTLLVARAADLQGRGIAALMNYACHPTTLAWDNRLISPDFPGAARETVEQALGLPCVFLQGASGDLGPRHGFVGDVEVADRNGRQLGYAALAAWTALPPPLTRFEYAGPVVSGATIGTWRYAAGDATRRADAARWGVSREVLPLRYRAGLPALEHVEAERRRWLADEQAAIAAGDELRQRNCRAMVERHTRMIARLKLLPPGDQFPFQLFAWRMGDAVWLAAQGETYSLLQTAVRRRFPNRPIIVCTLANGWGPSYLPPAELYDRGIYQESIAMLAPGCLEAVVAEAIERLERLFAAPAAA